MANLPKGSDAKSWV